VPAPSGTMEGKKTHNNHPVSPGKGASGTGTTLSNTKKEEGGGPRGGRREKELPTLEEWSSILIEGDEEHK